MQNSKEEDGRLAAVMDELAAIGEETFRRANLGDVALSIELDLRSRRGPVLTFRFQLEQLTTPRVTLHTYVGDDDEVWWRNDAA